MSRSIDKLGFLTIGTFDGAEPRAGLEDALELFAHAERLGFDSGWVRTRHLQFGISAPAVFLAAAAQRTTRLELGTAVIPLGYENPFGLAEALGTADVLSGGRLQVGLSVGRPRDYDEIGEHLWGAAKDVQDFSYARIDKLRELLRGAEISSGAGTIGSETYASTIQPISPGLDGRIRYGAGSERSARWAGGSGLSMLLSNVTTAESSEDFSESQYRLIQAFREAHPLGERARVSQGRVVIPLDSASAAQAEKYRAYAAARDPRTTSPQGPGRTLFARDVIGTSAEIAETLLADRAFRELDEFIVELPFVFASEDYRQLLHDVATTLGPLLGWAPRDAG